MRRIPPLSAVRAFEAAARLGNFTRAGEDLGMTQAAVSYQIRLLEERLGTPLFHRLKGRVSLTETGARIAPMVSSAFDALDDAFGVARTETENVLTISCSGAFAASWMAPRIGAFQMQRPSLAVRLQSANHYVDFAREEVDVAVRIGLGSWPGLATHFLMRSGAALFASPAFIERNGPIDDPGKVLELQRISPDDDYWNVWFSQFGLHIPVRTDTPGIRLDMQAMEAQAAIAGHGIAILNPVMWRVEVAAGLLVQLPFPPAFDARSYWLVYPEHKRRTAKVSAFRDWLLAEFAHVAALDKTGVYVPPQ